MYGANWCPDCKRAKKFLGEQMIHYEWVDIEKDAAARKARSCSSLLLPLSIACLTVALLACSPAAPPTPAPPRTTIFIPTQAPLLAPTDTPLPPPPPPTATLVVAPTATRAPVASPTRTPTLSAGTMRVKIFLIALEDNGKTGKKIGCNDSVIAVERAIPATIAPLTASLKELFALNEKNYGQSGLYNALYQSRLEVDGISIVSGRARIELSGRLVLGGICDNPRVEAQIKETALQFSTVRSVAVFLNNIPLEKALSEK
jgi:hypothetical protein